MLSIDTKWISYQLIHFAFSELYNIYFKIEKIKRSCGVKKMTPHMNFYMNNLTKGLPTPLAPVK